MTTPTPEELIPDSEIDRVHAFANFGSTPKREVVNLTVLKCACGFHSGYTAMQIVTEHGLIKPAKRKGAPILTKLGRRYLWCAYGRSEW